MKDLNIQETKEDKIEILKLQVQEKQTVFEGTHTPQKNHILFEINYIEGTINVAQFDEIPPIKYTDAMRGIISHQRKITRKENCIYISAINKENALKKLRNL